MMIHETEFYSVHKNSMQSHHKTECNKIFDYVAEHSKKMGWGVDIKL